MLKSRTNTLTHQTRKQPFPSTSSKRNYSKTILSSYQHQYKNQIRLSSSSNKKSRSLIDPSDDSLILLVDFKADPNICAKLLSKAIEPLKPYLSKVKNGKYYKGQVTIIVSGSKPKEENLFERSVGSKSDDNYMLESSNDKTVNIAKPFFGRNQSLKNMIRPFGFANVILRQSNYHSMIPMEQQQHEQTVQSKERYLFMDGRVNDLYQQKSTSMYPLISLNWSTVQFYRLLGKGDEFMKECADLAHSQGKRLRIWGAPNIESIWRRMMRSNVDWLSIDDHDRFARFAMKSS